MQLAAAIAGQNQGRQWLRCPLRIEGVGRVGGGRERLSIEAQQGLETRRSKPALREWRQRMRRQRQAR